MSDERTPGDDVDAPPRWGIRTTGAAAPASAPVGPDPAALDPASTDPTTTEPAARASRRRRRVVTGLAVLAAALLIAVEVALEDPGPFALLGGSHSVGVPLDVDRSDGAVDVQVAVVINGRGPFHLTLDTGAATSSLSANVLDAIGADDTGRSDDWYDAAGGKHREELYRVRSWSIGGVPLDASQDVGALVDEGEEAGDGPGDGLLGSDQLDRFRSVTIDWSHDRLLVQPR